MTPLASRKKHMYSFQPFSYTIPPLRKISRVLQFTCICLFLGRAWQYLFWEAPYRVLLWDQELMEPLVTRLTSMTWEEYATSSVVDGVMQAIIQGTGVLYLFCALAAWLIQPNRQYTRIILWIGTLFLILLALLYYKDKFYQTGQLFEYAAQCISPILLIILLFRTWRLSSVQLLANMAIAATFVSHGLYALGYYPQPGEYVDMLINSLGISEAIARQVLIGAGVLDVIISILVFIPATAKYALVYAIFWGALTTAARLFANLDLHFWDQSLHQWLFECLIRIPHVGIPLVSLLLVQASGRINQEGVLSPA